jgi:hypothetical protein
LKRQSPIYHPDNLKTKIRVNEKKNLPKPLLKMTKLKRRICFSGFNEKPNLRFKDDFVFALGCLTAGVSGRADGQDSIANQYHCQQTRPVPSGRSPVRCTLCSAAFLEWFFAL